MQSQCTYVLALCFTTLELRLNKWQNRQAKQNIKNNREKNIIHLCKLAANV